MNLVIDVGNTQTKLAWFEQGKLSETVRIDNGTTVIADLLSSKPASRAIISSTSHPDPVLSQTLEKTKTSVIQLDHHTPLPIKISYKTPETLGRDRIAAAAGARYVCPFCNVLVVDMGTAITIDFINAEGIYMGGNISPGMQMRFRALHEFTARLPLVQQDPAFSAFGTDTGSAISAGVQQGIIFEINSYIAEYTRSHPACEFIITGGDAGFFVSKLKRSIFAIPDLVLKGLNYILEYNISGKMP